MALSATLVLPLSSAAALATSGPAISTPSGQTDPRTLPRDQRPAPQSPVVTAVAGPHGVAVHWRHAAYNAQSFTLNRTDSSGAVVTLTAAPIAGEIFHDTTAVAGQTYTYTVTVASVTEGTSPPANAAYPQATVGSVVGTATATAVADRRPAAPKTPTVRTAHVVAVSAARTVHRVVAPLTATPGAAPKITDTGGCVLGASGPVTISTTVTWQSSTTNCPDGYLLKNDLTIAPAGSVTLGPGTILYLLAGPAGSSTAGTATNPTTHVDIVVRGAFTVAGQAGDMATITSSNASSTNTTNPPQAGDWGDIFYDGTGGNTPSGSISYANIAYGNKVLADHYALPISNSTIDQMAGSDSTSAYDGAGVDIRDLPAGATETITGLSYDGTHAQSGVWIQSLEKPDMSGATYHGNGMTVDVTNSTISGYYPLYVEDDANAATDPSGTGNASVNFAVTGDTLNAVGGGYAFSPEAYQNSSDHPGTATVVGTISGTTVSTDNYSSSSEGVYPYAESSDAAAPANGSSATSCAGAGACVDVTATNDAISAYGYALDSEAYVDSGTGDAVNILPVAGGSLTSAYGYPLYEDVEQRGTAGAADNYTSMSGTPNSGYDGDYAYTRSSNGSAVSSPSFTNSPITSHHSYGLYNEVYAARQQATSGAAVASPSFAGSSVVSYYAALYNYAESDKGQSTASPTITGGTFTVVEDDLVDNYAYASHSAAATPANSTDTAVNDAVASPRIGGLTATDNYYYATGLANSADSGYGSATADPALTDTTLTMYSDSGSTYGVDNEATGSSSGSPTAGTGAATADPTLMGTKVMAYDDALYNFAESHRGIAQADPSVLADAAGAPSTLDSNDYEGIENYAYGAKTAGPTAATDSPWTAQASPTVSGSTIYAYDNPVYTEAHAYNGQGSASASPTLDHATLTGDDGYDAVDAYATSSGNGDAATLTDVTSSTLQGPYGAEGIYADPVTSGTGTAHVGGTVADSTIQSDYESYYADGSLATGPYLFDTTFTNDTLSSTDDDALESDVSTEGGSVRLAPTITGGSFSAPSDGAVELYASGYGSHATDTVEVAPVVSGAQLTSYGSALYADAYNYGYAAHPGSVHVGGSVTSSTINSLDGYGIRAIASCRHCVDSVHGATVDLAAKDTSIFSYDEAGYFSAYSGNNGSPAISAPTITSDSYSTWDSYDDYAVRSRASSTGTGAATNAPTVTGMHASGYYGDYRGSADGGSNGDATNAGALKANVFDNKWQATDDYGVELSTYASGTHTATDTSTITGNTVENMLGSDGAGIHDSVQAAAGHEHVAPQITGNVVSSVGGDGVVVTTTAHSPTGQSIGQTGAYYPTITGNTVRDTGGNGLLVNGVLADIAGNWQSQSAQAGPYGAAGIAVKNAADAGSVTCNAITGNADGVLYQGNTADPVTQNNAFDVAGTTNGPLNLLSNATGTTTATGNWFGPYSTAQIAASVKDSSTGTITWQPAATAVPGCVPVGPTAPINPSGGVNNGGGGGFVQPSGTVTTLSSANPLGPNNPVVVGVTDPQGGPITFAPATAPTTPAGLVGLGSAAFDISAPASTASKPLTLEFTVDPSAGPQGMPVVVVVNGTPVTNGCTSASTASPDPCVLSYGVSGSGVRTITVLSSHASTWSLATPTSGGIALACAGKTTSPFGDVGADVAAQAIACVNAYGIALGTTATTFSPGRPVTRAEMAGFLVRLLKAAHVTLPSGASGPFADIANSGFVTQVNQLAALGVTQGVRPGVFNPGGTVSRGEMAAFLVRAYQLAVGYALPAATASPFGDTAGSTFAGDIAKVAEVGIAVGKTATTFAPALPVPRDEMALFVARTLNLLDAQGLVS